mmetsp:Transcript_44248/g.123071  ORF Transcript_44248/g.123071 Transcript_44248/m.123071 type:complete len:447 (-) Transcript_44248:492-1832(-)
MRWAGARSAVWRSLRVATPPVVRRRAARGEVRRRLGLRALVDVLRRRRPGHGRCARVELRRLGRETPAAWRGGGRLRGRRRLDLLVHHAPHLLEDDLLLGPRHALEAHALLGLQLQDLDGVPHELVHVQGLQRRSRRLVQAVGQGAELPLAAAQPLALLRGGVRADTLRAPRGHGEEGGGGAVLPLQHGVALGGLPDEGVLRLLLRRARGARLLEAGEAAGPPLHLGLRLLRGERPHLHWQLLLLHEVAVGVRRARLGPGAPAPLAHARAEDHIRGVAVQHGAGVLPQGVGRAVVGEGVGHREGQRPALEGRDGARRLRVGDVVGSRARRLLHPARDAVDEVLRLGHRRALVAVDDLAHRRVRLQPALQGVGPRVRVVLVPARRGVEVAPRLPLPHRPATLGAEGVKGVHGLEDVVRAGAGDVLRAVDLVHDVLAHPLVPPEGSVH